jgi:hypothetical protein
MPAISASLNTDLLKTWANESESPVENRPKTLWRNAPKEALCALNTSAPGNLSTVPSFRPRIEQLFISRTVKMLGLSRSGLSGEFKVRAPPHYGERAANAADGSQDTRLRMAYDIVC